MIVFAAITPHPPVLIPTIGKENVEKIKSTKQALENLAKKLEILKPERIIIISGHGSVLKDKFSVFSQEKYEADFNEFGDFSSKLEFSPDFEFIAKLKSASRLQGLNIIVKAEKLDYGSAIPLNFLLNTEDTKKIKVVAITHSFLPIESHYKFGQIIGSEILKLGKRTAIIASGDLSHKLLPDSPAGYWDKAIEFDKNFIDLLAKNDHEKFLKFNKKNIENAAECLYYTQGIMLGLLKGQNIKFNMHSYEYPFGVGYLVADYDFI